MRCYNHPKIEAVGVCKNCGKGTCKECTRTQDNGLFCAGCSTTVAREEYSPVEIAFMNLILLGAGFFIMKEWGKGLLSIFAAIVAYYISGWFGVAIVYLFVMAICYDTAISLNKGRMIDTSIPKNSGHASASIEKKEKEIVKEESKPVEADVLKVKKPEDVPKPSTSGLSHLSPASIFYGVMMLLFALVSLSIIALMVFNFFANNQYGSFGQAVLGNVLCCFPVLFLSGIFGTVFGVMFRQSIAKDNQSVLKQAE